MHNALLRVCVPAVAKVIGALDLFASRGLEVILRVSVVVPTQSTKFVFIAVKLSHLKVNQAIKVVIKILL